MILNWSIVNQRLTEIARTCACASVVAPYRKVCACVKYDDALSRWLLGCFHWFSMTAGERCSLLKSEERCTMTAVFGYDATHAKHIVSEKYTYSYLFEAFSDIFKQFKNFRNFFLMICFEAWQNFSLLTGNTTYLCLYYARQRPTAIKSSFITS